MKRLLGSATITIVAAALAALAAPAATSLVASGPFDGCPVRGSGGDPILNALKNRSAVPDSTEPITVAQLKTYPAVPAGAGTLESKWPTDVRSTIDAKEDGAVVLTGYIVKVTHESDDPSNCASTDPKAQDVEMYVTEHAGNIGATHLILAEATPRWRAVYTTWGAKKLQTVADAGTRVRITGWPLYDLEDWADLQGSIATPWEIEPVTRIEVWSNGAWSDY